MTTWLLSAAFASAPCDIDNLLALAGSLSQVDGPDRVAHAALGVGLSCGATSALADGASRFVEAPPELRPLVDAELVLTTPTEWRAVCLGGLPALSEVSGLRADEQRRLLFLRCGLEQRGWFSEAEWTAAGGTVVLSLVTGQVLRSTQAPGDLVRTLVRALAGIEDAPVPAQPAPGAPPPESLVSASNERNPLWHALMDLDLPTEGVGPGRSPPAGPRPEDREPRLHAPSWSPSIDLEGEPGEAGPAGFARRVEPTWGRGARREGGSCTAEIFVGADGDLLDLRFLGCAEALQADVRAAVLASPLRPASVGGVPTAGRFTETWTP